MATDYDLKEFGGFGGIANLFAEKPYKEALLKQQQQKQLIEGLNSLGSAIGTAGNTIMQRKRAMAQALAQADLLSPPPTQKPTMQTALPSLPQDQPSEPNQSLPPEAQPNQSLLPPNFQMAAIPAQADQAQPTAIPPNMEAMRERLATAIEGTSGGDFLKLIKGNDQIQETVYQKNSQGNIIGTQTRMVPKGSKSTVIGPQVKTGTAGANWETATPEQRRLAVAYYNGDIKSSDLGYKDKGLLGILANEYAINNGLPSFKSYSANVKEGMAKFSTTGKLGQNATSLNTALGHASSALDAFNAIGNTNQRWLNTPINTLKSNTDDPNVAALEVSLTALQGELANVFKNTGGTDQEIAKWQSSLSSSLTPNQAQAAIRQVNSLLNSRINALDYQRSTAGGGTGAPLLSPHAKQINDELSATSTNPDLVHFSTADLKSMLKKAEAHKETK